MQSSGNFVAVKQIGQVSRIAFVAGTHDSRWWNRLTNEKNDPVESNPGNVSWDDNLAPV